MAETPIVLLSSLFPHEGAPGTGLFIRERMFRVGRTMPLIVVSPRPWFPGQSLLRRFRPGYRLPAARHEIQDGVHVYFPLFFALPGLLRRFDGFFMALGAWRTLLRLKKQGFDFAVIDAHFAYPDGYAGTLLARWFGVPCTITLRGTEVPHSRNPVIRPLLVRALMRADRVFSVSESLRQLAIGLGMPAAKGRVVGNGVDIDKFSPIDRREARRACKLPDDVKVLISVGALVERKGFHRVIECLPSLIDRHPGLRYLVVGGGSPEGNMEDELRALVARLGLQSHVVFCGPMKPADLSTVLSAADVFVLATRNEGWANVFLEAMACGLPVIATDVGGNREVVGDPALGRIVPFGDAAALGRALDEALVQDWDRHGIVAHARANTWDERVKVLIAEFEALARVRAGTAPAKGLSGSGKA
ncbi:glycosyltransferase [Methyloversatilis sp.]|uniref:glycosyltransferase n=1 Tax=Methyloversatilis sp. TaxID=2569862 RepID=UPI0035B442A9